MKTKLLLMLTFLISVTSFSQTNSVALVGAAVAGWNPAVAAPLTSTDGGLNFTATIQLSANGCKFIIDAIGEPGNWCGYDNTLVTASINGFPTGTGRRDGVPEVSDIIIPTAGYYLVAIKASDKTYSFTAVADPNAEIKITGTSAGSGQTLVTTDGISYEKKNLALVAGNAKFTQTSPIVNWSSGSFPLGTATVGGADIPVTANNYNVNFNKITGAYAFNFVSVSIIGQGVGGWSDSNDIAMTTTDGVNYSLSNQVVGGTGDASSAMKFRVNGAWAVQFGNTTFPAGTGVGSSNDPDIIGTPGTYNITLNRLTKAYNFGPNLATNTFEKTSFKVSPNPTNKFWKIASSEIEFKAVQIIDVLGKIVFSNNSASNELNIDASTFINGIYFAKITTANGFETIKLVKN